MSCKQKLLGYTRAHTTLNINMQPHTHTQTHAYKHAHLNAHTWPNVQTNTTIWLLTNTCTQCTPARTHIYTRDKHASTHKQPHHQYLLGLDAERLGKISEHHLPLLHLCRQVNTRLPTSPNARTSQISKMTAVCLFKFLQIKKINTKNVQ